MKTFLQYVAEGYKRGFIGLGALKRASKDEYKSLLNKVDSSHPGAYWDSDPYFKEHGKTTRVPVEKLKATQHYVASSRIQKYSIKHHSQMEHPQAFKHNGQYYVWNGHHRVVAKIRAGVKLLRAKVIDLDKDE